MRTSVADTMQMVLKVCHRLSESSPLSLVKCIMECMSQRPLCKDLGHSHMIKFASKMWSVNCGITTVQSMTDLAIE